MSTVVEPPLNSDPRQADCPKVVAGGRIVHDRWQGVSLRQLAALMAVAEERSFRRAAERLGYVQSAISGQIAQLENAAGVRLLDRASGTSAIALTPAGELLLAHATEILARLGAAHEAVASLSERRASEVRVAGLERLGPRAAARTLRQFQDRCPCARPVFVSCDPEQDALDLLITDQAEAVIAELPLADGPFAHNAVQCQPYVLVVNPASPLLANDGMPTAAELRALPLIVATNCSETLQARLLELGFQRRSHLTPSSFSLARAFVAAGVGEAIIPRPMVESVGETVTAIEFPGLLPERALAVVVHAERRQSTSVHAFRHAVRTACAAERARELNASAS